MTTPSSGVAPREVPIRIVALRLILESLNKDEQSVLDSRISKGKLLRTFFSSTTVVVGGIKGELYVSHAKLNPTAREFQWLPSGTELGNRLKPLIMIDGRIDTHDFPAEYRDKISGEEMILWILESIKMRTGGDEDILSHR
jgi:large subunit ribosomal protein L24